MITPERDDEHPDAQLIPFPIQPPVPSGPVVRPEAAIEPASEVLDGELISEDEYQRTRLRRVTAVVVRGADRTRGATAAVAPRVAPPARLVARAVYTVGAGHVSWARRAAGALTHAPVREQIRRARTMGDPAALAEWTERLVSLKDKRAKRLRELPATLLGAAKALLAALGALAGLLVLTGVWVAVRPGGMGWSDWWSLVGDIANGAGTVMYAGVSVAVWLLLPALLLAGWLEGRRVASAPRWLATSADADVDIAIDETTIANALAALRIQQITAYLKQGLPLQYITVPRRDGRGTHAVLRLPAGVTAERIAQRRADLATGLHRLAKEVWPTTGSEAGILDLWVADKGALAEGAGPYPLLEQGVVDVFKGVPFGKTLRGDPIVAPMMERNTITGGMPGQGKSAAARVLMAGAALDPTAELRIWVPDSNFDFEAFRPRCSRFVVGAEDERVEEILEDLRELQAEVQARGDLLIEHEEAAVTRALASKNIGLHPCFAC
jgi:DNA segregation ATPase FtsK/SpoIIIE, S-DNA-T family